MLKRFRTRNRNREIVDELYHAVVEDARQPLLYTRYGLPDTVMGRFESLGIHVFLVLARCRNDPALRPLAQDLVDRFILDVEDSIREIGIGDVSVPKRMRKLAGMFYERIGAYEGPLDAADTEGLAKALERHAMDDGFLEAEPEGLAAYMIEKKAAYDCVPSASLLRGLLHPEIDGHGKDARR